MKVYEFGEQGKPVLMLLPGTGCYWRSNFGKVIEPLAETFRVACVSYDGFNAVSYTHLDVYKRQVQDTVIMMKHMITAIWMCIAGCTRHFPKFRNIWTRTEASHSF